MEDLYFDSTSLEIEEVCVKHEESYDTLSPIANQNIPEFLLVLELDSLYNLSLINRRIHSIVRNNTFWYLKMEKDFSPWYNHGYNEATKVISVKLYINILWIIVWIIICFS